MNLSFISRNEVEGCNQENTGHCCKPNNGLRIAQDKTKKWT